MPQKTWYVGRPGFYAILEYDGPTAKTLAHFKARELTRNLKTIYITSTNPNVFMLDPKNQ